jgi:hypothetical protein
MNQPIAVKATAICTKVLARNEAFTAETYTCGSCKKDRSPAHRIDNIPPTTSEESDTKAEIGGKANTYGMILLAT